MINILNIIQPHRVCSLPHTQFCENFPFFLLHSSSIVGIITREIKDMKIETNQQRIVNKSLGYYYVS
jgi:hypothetical protein